MKPLIKQIISSLTITLVGYSSGVVLAYPGVFLSQIKVQSPELSLSTSEGSWFASIAQLVAIPGSILAGIFLEKFGPRKLVLLSLLPLALTWIVIDYAVYYPILLISIRAFQGVINSFLGTVAYVYPCEIADKKRRGVLGALADSSFSLGFLVTYLVGGIVPWRYFGFVILAITVFPCFIGVYYVPESPVWLIRHGKYVNAKKVLSKIRKKEEVEGELLAYEEKARGDVNMSSAQRIKLLGKTSNFLAVSSAVMLLVLKEATGQFAIVLFIFDIFQRANPSLSVYWCSVIVGSTRLLSNLISSLLLAKIPRRTLIAIPCFIEIFSLVALGLYFYLDSWRTSPELSFLPVALLMISVICYGFGPGPASWILATEIQPSSVRNIGSGIGQAGFCLAQWLVAGSFSKIDEHLGLYTCFWIYSVGCLLTAVFVLTCLPETKGKSLIEIEDYWCNIEEKLVKATKTISRRTNDDTHSSTNPAVI